MKITPPLVLMLAGMARVATAQPFLPQCGPGLDSQVSKSGCICRYEGASQLEDRGPGWRWSCDLLRGSAPPQPATDAPTLATPNLPPGVVYTPHAGSWHGY